MSPNNALWCAKPLALEGGGERDGRLGYGLGLLSSRLDRAEPSRAGPGQWLAHITGILAPAFYRRLFSLYLWMCVSLCCVWVCVLLLLCVQYLLATALQFSSLTLTLTLGLPFSSAYSIFFPPLLQPFSLIFICFSFNLFCHFVFLSAVIVVVAIFIAFITNTHTQTHTDIYIYIYTLTHVASSNIVCPSQPQCVSSL